MSVCTLNFLLLTSASWLSLDASVGPKKQRPERTPGGGKTQPMLSKSVECQTSQSFVAAVTEGSGGSALPLCHPGSLAPMSSKSEIINDLRLIYCLKLVSEMSGEGTLWHSSFPFDTASLTTPAVVITDLRGAEALSCLSLAK